MTLNVDPAKLATASGVISGKSKDFKHLHDGVKKAFDAASSAAGDGDASAAATHAGTQFSTLAGGLGVAMLMLGSKARLAATVFAADDKAAANQQTHTGGKKAV